MLYNVYSEKMSIRTKSKKDPISYFNIMVVGASGSGKTAFVRTLCETLKNEVIEGSYKESKPMALKNSLEPTEGLYTVSMQIEKEGQRTALTVIDTPGFAAGFAIDHHLSYIAKYIDYQFARTLTEETKVRRDAKAHDTHIHACLYFVDTSQVKGLSETDKYIFKFLSSRVNVIPIIGKSDTLTATQRTLLQSSLRSEIIETLQVPVYGYIDMEEQDSTQTQMEKIKTLLQTCVEEDHDEEASAMIDYLDQFPFSVFSFEHDPYTGHPIQMGRRYPWATTCCLLNIKICLEWTHLNGFMNNTAQSI
ncbi:hypothetical protein CU098_009052 [Rhizopus stolonifer]|uniref:Septin-type G domain-containing protein n=1 Tax=Rhizopus stolonifer TaxID=4846 RepID=A0A367KXU8_RHIST|nr:hypothetical protein CU098_009052 [Rhizopus stolonifer]